MSSLGDCSVKTCDINTSLYGYRPSIGANSFFLAVASLCLVAFVAVYIAKRRLLAFTIVLAIACILDIVGYSQRIRGWDNPWDLTPFINGIICLTIAPVFITAGIYFCLSQITNVLGREYSFLKPEWYTRVFVTADVLCLAIQAAGGGLAFSDSSDDSGLGPNADTGLHIIVVGLAVQILSLAVFLALFSSILIRRASGSRKHLEGEYNSIYSTPLTGKFKAFVGVLLFVSVCILVRCVYRVVEFADGLNSSLAQDEGLFIGMDSAMVAVTFIGLSICHPALFL